MSILSESATSYVKTRLRKRGLMLQRHPLWYCFEQVKPTVVLDVGANVGTYGGELRTLGFNGQIHSFEPFPPSFAALQKTADLSRPKNAWHCHHVGLGEKTGEAVMNVFNESVFNSLREKLPDSDGLHAGIHGDKTVSVKVRTLAEVWPELKLENERVHLKIDTQGFEMPILKGAGRVLQKMTTLQLEISLTAIYKDQPCIEEMVPFLRNAGFAIFDVLHAGGIRGKHRELLEVDFLFIKV